VAAGSSQSATAYINLILSVRSLLSPRTLAGGVSLFVNAQRSWACVRRRQHCFRNLDVDYLTIKAFLLERFLHDALYEAPTAEVFNEFLDIRPAPAAQVSFASSPSLPRSAVSGSLSR